MIAPRGAMSKMIALRGRMIALNVTNLLDATSATAVTRMIVTMIAGTTTINKIIAGTDTKESSVKRVTLALAKPTTMSDTMITGTTTNNTMTAGADMTETTVEQTIVASAKPTIATMTIEFWQ